MRLLFWQMILPLPQKEERLEHSMLSFLLRWLLLILSQVSNMCVCVWKKKFVSLFISVSPPTPLTSVHCALSTQSHTHAHIRHTIFTQWFWWWCNQPGRTGHYSPLCILKHTILNKVDCAISYKISCWFTTVIIIKFVGWNQQYRSSFESLTNRPSWRLSTSTIAPITTIATRMRRGRRGAAAAAAAQGR